MGVLLANNATSTLAAGIAAGATSLTVQAADASRFPAPTGGDWFPLTIVDTLGSFEIVRCTARAGATLTIARAQEGTTAKAFLAGARADLRLTAGAVAAKQDALSLSPTISSFLAAADAPAARAAIDAGNASTLTSGTVADARLPARQSSKSFGSPLEVSANPGVYGSVELVTGTSTYPGYIAFKEKDGTRRGYIGTVASPNKIRLQAEGGWGWYVAGPTEFTHSPDVAGSTMWHAGNDGAGSGLDADQLDGMQPSTSASPNTIVQRNGSGYVHAVIYNMNYAPTNPTVNLIMTQNGSDGYIRSSTPVQVAGALAPLLTYQGTGASDTDFPIGHTVVAHKGPPPYLARNATGTVRLATEPARYEVDVGSGSALSGVWRARGMLNYGGDAEFIMERVA